MLGFVFGAIAGGVAAYYWRDQIRAYMKDGMPGMRDRAAERLGELGERAGSALDRARSRIDTTIRTGQEKLRSTETTRPADGDSGTGSGRSASTPRAPGL